MQVFIFASAYGLAKSHWDNNEGWWEFLSGRVRKIYPAFLLIVVSWFAVVCSQHGTEVALKRIGLQLALMFVGLSTFLPHAGLPPIGPWWFIPFILQFYAIWPWLRRFAQRFGGFGLILLPVAGTLLLDILNPLLEPWDINLLTTPLGRFPSICMGIAAARFGLRIPGWLAAAALPTLLLASRFEVLWRLSTPSALVLMLWCYLQVREYLRGWRWLERLGDYSLIVFLVNGIVREHLVTLASTAGLQFALAAADLLICIVIAAALQPFLERYRPPQIAPAQA